LSKDLAFKTLIYAGTAIVITFGITFGLCYTVYHTVTDAIKLSKPGSEAEKEYCEQLENRSKATGRGAAKGFQEGYGKPSWLMWNHPSDPKKEGGPQSSWMWYNPPDPKKTEDPQRKDEHKSI